jgi:hypothetical protein
MFTKNYRELFYSTKMTQGIMFCADDWVMEDLEKSTSSPPSGIVPSTQQNTRNSPGTRYKDW